MRPRGTHTGTRGPRAASAPVPLSVADLSTRRDEWGRGVGPGGVVVSGYQPTSQDGTLERSGRGSRGPPTLMGPGPRPRRPRSHGPDGRPPLRRPPVGARGPLRRVPLRVGESEVPSGTREEVTSESERGEAGGPGPEDAPLLYPQVIDPIRPTSSSEDPRG